MQKVAREINNSHAEPSRKCLWRCSLNERCIFLLLHHGKLNLNFPFELLELVTGKQLKQGMHNLRSHAAFSKNLCGRANVIWMMSYVIWMLWWPCIIKDSLFNVCGYSAKRRLKAVWKQKRNSAQKIKITWTHWRP